METKEVLQQLRKKHHLTQEEMAARLLVTRQAVSRWETGETIPNAETLKLISKEFQVSINTLLGMPRRLFCQCCGMPLDDDAILSREKDGTLNEDYCKWCYVDGVFTYTSMEALIAYCIPLLQEQFPDAAEQDLRSLMEKQLPQLKYWKDKK